MNTETIQAVISSHDFDAGNFELITNLYTDHVDYGVEYETYSDTYSTIESLHLKEKELYITLKEVFHTYIIRIKDIKDLKIKHL